MTKNSHCIGLVFSLKKRTANMAAKIGAIYLRETAVATGIYFMDIKKKVIDVTPVKPRNTNNFLLLPKTGIPVFNKKNIVKTKELNDLKKTI
jgi:hypothetical protein